MITDVTQRKIPRHPAREVTNLAMELQSTTAQDFLMLTTDEVLDLIGSSIKAKIADGVPWKRLEVWFARQGFPDITEATYRQWYERTRQKVVI